MVKFCKETGEEQKPNGDCLIHGNQPESHFDFEPDNRSCECGHPCVYIPPTKLRD